jgi:tetraacyldisaccharide 4'-kinase
MLIIWKKTFLSFVLWPFSLLYQVFIFLRRKCYQWGIKKVTHFPIPVIIVGNITVGGSGKTPLLIELAKFLTKKNWRPGIISRGYGGKAKSYPAFVHKKSNPRELGDEPLLIARQTSCPTVVDPKRCRAVNRLLEKTDCNIVLSDDGLQHLALGRNIEIVVIDGQHRFGNHLCLPAGPLREPISRLKTVDFIVTKGKAHVNEYEMMLYPDHFYQLIQPENKKNLHYFTGKKLHAVAGIGNPEQFFSSLRALGLHIIEHAFPDHHFFKASDLAFGTEAIILMTEKDAVKCERLADARLWCLKTITKVDATFFAALLKRIANLGSNPKSALNSCEYP